MFNFNLHSFKEHELYFSIHSCLKLSFILLDRYALIPPMICRVGIVCMVIYCKMRVLTTSWVCQRWDSERIRVRVILAQSTILCFLIFWFHLFRLFLRTTIIAMWKHNPLFFCPYFDMVYYSAEQTWFVAFGHFNFEYSPATRRAIWYSMGFHMLDWSESGRLRNKRSLIAWLSLTLFGFYGACCYFLRSSSCLARFGNRDKDESTNNAMKRWDSASDIQ